jgi:hypothetical protein
MKALKLIITGMALCFAGAVQAQVSVNVNIGSPPQWGPAGYSDVQYYYLPDVEAYYDVPSSRFIYYEQGVWVHRTYLPRRYRNYDLYGGYKVVMRDYRGNAPYSHFKEYKTKYARGYRGHAQTNIGHRPGRGHDNARMHNEGRSYKQGNQGKGGGHDGGKGHGGGKGHRK